MNPNNYKKQPLPNAPSIVKNEYFSKNFETRRIMNKNPDTYKGFWNHYEVIEYFNTVSLIRSHNWANRRFLIQLREEAKGRMEDVSQHDALIAEFEPGDYLLPIEIRTHDNVPDEAQAVAERFGGTVQRYESRKDWVD